MKLQDIKLLEGVDEENMFQVRVGSGSWKDVNLYFDDLKDIADRVNHPLRGPGKTDLGQLSELIQDYIGPGPDGHGSTWDEIDFDVASLKDDVLKITYHFGGVNMSGTKRRTNPDRYGEPVVKTGTITFMPGN